MIRLLVQSVYLHSSTYLGARMILFLMLSNLILLNSPKGVVIFRILYRLLMLNSYMSNSNNLERRYDTRAYSSLYIKLSGYVTKTMFRPILNTLSSWIHYVSLKDVFYYEAVT